MPANVSRALSIGFIVLSLWTSHARAEDRPQGWQVSKSSGDVWVVSGKAQNVSLSAETALNAGDSIRTGKSGRVMLKRGTETIMIAPNSVIAIPAELKEGATTIVQQAGSILLEVNKRDARTFEVETPYLVAAVKGTQFRVTVGPKGSDVAVQHGSVEVADSKTGKFALVFPGQSANVSSTGGGLTLQGQGALSPIQNGAPRATSITRVPVPAQGLKAPSATRAGLQVRPLSVAAPLRGNVAIGGMRIASPIGAVRLDVSTATKGLARDAAAPAGSRSAATIWNGNAAGPAAVVTASSNANASITTPTVVTGVSANSSPIANSGRSPPAAAVTAPNVIATPAVDGRGNGNAAGHAIGPGNGNSPNANNGGGRGVGLGVGVGVGQGGYGIGRGNSGNVVHVGNGGIGVGVGVGNNGLALGLGNGLGGGNGNGNNGNGHGNGGSSGNSGQGNANSNGGGNGNGNNGLGLALGRTR